jgi:hypothetical protein
MISLPLNQPPAFFRGFKAKVTNNNSRVLLSLVLAAVALKPAVVVLSIVQVVVTMTKAPVVQVLLMTLM